MANNHPNPSMFARLCSGLANNTLNLPICSVPQIELATWTEMFKE